MSDPTMFPPATPDPAKPAADPAATPASPAPEAAWPGTTTAAHTDTTATADAPVVEPAPVMIDQAQVPDVVPGVGGVLKPVEKAPAAETIPGVVDANTAVNQADIAGIALPSPNTTPHDPAAAFMPGVLTATAEQPPIAPGNPPVVAAVAQASAPAGWQEPDYTGHQIAEVFQGATFWTSPAGVEYLVDPATGKITGKANVEAAAHPEVIEGDIFVDASGHDIGNAGHTGPPAV